jgi:hypothetical protein
VKLTAPVVEEEIFIVRERVEEMEAEKCLKGFWSRLLERLETTAALLPVGAVRSFAQRMK